MDDIDRTFNRLRRIDITELTAKYSPIIDPVRFIPVYTHHSEQRLNSCGWIIDEANEALEEKWKILIVHTKDY